ncbi:hypothetical protein MTP99_018698 [Tenebrio molitor]|nr:hypothetical protein MTP99_018698 [Tenebrio molitor]
MYCCGWGWGTYLLNNLGSEVGLSVSCLCSFLWRFSGCCWGEVPTLSTLLLFDTMACWTSLGGGTLERVRPNGVFLMSPSLACRCLCACSESRSVTLL